MSTTWIYHPDLDTKSEVPDVSVPNYVARGWQITDPPVEPDLEAIDEDAPGQLGGAAAAVDSTEAPASAPKE
jgi:hypothetical protein